MALLWPRTSIIGLVMSKRPILAPRFQPRRAMLTRGIPLYLQPGEVRIGTSHRRGGVFWFRFPVGQPNCAFLLRNRSYIGISRKAVGQPRFKTWIAPMESAGKSLNVGLPSLRRIPNEIDSRWSVLSIYGMPVNYFRARKRRYKALQSGLRFESVAS